MSTKFSHTKKKKLAERISNITDIKELKTIKKIIFDFNPDLPVSKNPSGMLMYFQNLEEETYTELENFLDKKILKECAKKVKNINNLESILSSDILSSSNVISDNSDQHVSKFKYSNKEKNIMRRKNYEKKINEINGTDTMMIDFENYVETPSNNIFIKKIDK